MKKINKISRVILLILTVSLFSCETTDLDLKTDPNNIALTQGDVEYLTNSIQLDFAEFMRSISDRGAKLVRIENMRGRQYQTAFSPEFLNYAWATAYAGVFSDIALAEPLAVENEMNVHLGVMKTLKAFALITLVDFFGDIPYSQISKPKEFPSPVADPGADVYAAALGLLDEATAHFNEGGTKLDNDLYYNNDTTKWLRLVNTIKMEIYLNTRLVDAGAQSKFNAIANDENNYISNPGVDFQLNYGDNQSDPDIRHPGYSNDYVPNGGAGSYRSVWFMAELSSSGDVRREYYTFRQSGCTPGSGCEPDPQTLPCSASDRPNHFPPDMPFCTIAGGYWGADHGNDGGIPPDTFNRSVVGLYPYGGRFDNGAAAGVKAGDGAGGAGIMPLMLSSWADLMRAEMFLANGDSGSAATAMEMGMTKSIQKVQSFITRDPQAKPETAPTQAQVTNFINKIVNNFNAGDATEKWNILAKQVFIACYGNGINPYNMYRRTGYPNDLQYNIEPNPGAFIRSLLYPANEANVNANITQKPDVKQQVFWDTNPAFPSFPYSN